MGTIKKIDKLEYIVNERQKGTNTKNTDELVFNIIEDLIENDLQQRHYINDRCVVLSVNNFYSVIRHLHTFYRLNINDEVYRFLKVNGYRIIRCIDFNDSDVEIF